MSQKLTTIVHLLLVTALVTAAVPAGAGWDEGVAAFTKRDFKTAATEFEQMVQQNPEGYRAQYMLGLSLEQLGQREKALDHLRKAYDLNPNDVSIKLALGRAYKNLRRYGEVAQLLAQVDVGSLPTAQQTAFYQMRGEARYRTNNAEAALGDFQQLAKLNPSDPQVQFLYGTTALALERMDTAISALAKAVSLAPSDLEKKRTYVNALIKQGRMTRDKEAKRQAYLKAANHAEDLAKAEPTYDNLVLEISAEIGAGLYAEAVATGEKAVAKAPGTDWLGHYYLGQAYTSNKQYDKAEAPLNQAMRIATDPKDVRLIQKQRGFVFEKQRDFAKAIEAYMAADDQSSVARVRNNEETFLENKRIEEENALIEQMRQEAEELEKQLEELEGGGGGGGR